jgi:hypothetical protein
MAYPNVDENAKACGAVRGEGGINWSWYYFPARDGADRFVAWLVSVGLEHRGVYEPRNPPRPDEWRDTLYGVRWR